MKNKFYLLITILFLSASIIVKAQFPNGFTNIDINNIDAGVTSSSDLFWDFSQAKFEVPKGGGKHAIFAGGMWIGGLDNGGIAHMGAQTYRQTGNDFYPGPIDTATGTPVNWTSWDKSWKLNKSDVLNHIQNYNTMGYVVPQNIAQWPGYDATLGRVLAPFADYNNNGIYDPANGDYPYIMGDQTVYSIYNDMRSHTESGCDSMGVEVHRTMFGFDAPNDTTLNNTIFSRYEIKNYSNTDYHDVYFTTWIDFDLGNAMDDYVGTDMNLNMIYAYNADNDDESSAGYGLNPPAVGVYFLNDSLTSSMAYDNVNNLPTGNPSNCADFINFGKGLWLDNQPITYGGDGRNFANPITNHMYPGTTNPVYFQTLGPWDEATAGNAPGDRRMIGSIGPFTLNAGGYISFDMGYTWARGTSGNSIVELQNAVSSLRVMYANGTLTSIDDLGTVQNNHIALYPNPANDFVTIENSFNTGKFDVAIKDALGKVIYTQSGIAGGKVNVNTSYFSKGLYVVTVTQNNNSFNSKLIIK